MKKGNTEDVKHEGKSGSRGSADFFSEIDLMLVKEEMS